MRCAALLTLLVAVLMFAAPLVAAEVQYVYDQAGRLRAAVYPNDLVKEYALDAAGNRTLVRTVANVPPSVPTGLTATGGAQQIALAWTASIAAADTTLAGYKIYRGGSLIATTTGPLTSYTDSGLPPLTAFTYTVAAYNTFNATSAQSGAAAATTLPDTTAPTQPQGVQATAISAIQVNVAWSASSDAGGSGLAGYRVLRNGTQIATTTTTSYSDVGLFPSTTYRYEVVAFDNAGNVSPRSSSASATTPADLVAPTTPSNVQAVAAASTRINLTWGASIDVGGAGLAGYRVFRNGVLIAETVTASYSDADVAPLTTYSYRVAAFDAVGNVSPQSTAVSSTTPRDSTPPSVPTGLVAVQVTATSVTLAWNASVDTGGSGLKGYYIDRENTQLNTTTTTSYTDTNVQGSRTYTFRIAAFDNSNNFSALSAPLTVTTPAPPVTAPVAPQWGAYSQCVNGNRCSIAGSLLLTWSAVPGATRYEFEHATFNLSNGAYIPFFNEDTGAPTDTVHLQEGFGRNSIGDDYRVRACNEICGPYSPILSFTLPPTNGPPRPPTPEDPPL